MTAPERIWMPPLWEVGDGTIPTDGQWEDDDIFYIRSDLHDAAIAKARAEGWEQAIQAVKVEVQEWLDIPHAPRRNPTAEVYDDACRNIMRFVCNLQPPSEGQP